MWLTISDDGPIHASRRGTSARGLKALLTAVALLAVAPVALGAACSSLASGNWNTQTTWGAAGTGCVGAVGGIPGAADSVSIGATHTVTLNANAAASSISITAATAANGVTLNGYTLNVGGTITMNAVSTNNRTSTFNVGTGTLTAASIAIASGSGSRVSLMTVSSGRITTTGSITFSGTAGNARLTSTGASSINVGANLGSGGTLTTSGTGTITFNGSGAQSIGAYVTYNNVVTANSGGGVSFLGGTTIGGTLSVNSGTLTVGAIALTVTGATTVTGTLTHNSTTGAKTYTGNVTINSGGVFSETVARAIAYGANVTVNSGGTLTEFGAATMSIAGSLSNSGTLTASSGVHTFSGAGKSFSGTIAIPSVTISGSYTNNGTLTVATALAGGAGTLINSAGGTLNLGGTSTIATLTATTSGNTVAYNGAAQTVKATSYDGLSIGGSGIKSLAGATTVGGTLTLSAGTLAVGANTLSLNGPSIAGTPSNLTTTASSRLSYGGSASGVNVPASVTALTNLTLNNSSGITLNGNLTLSGTLTLSSGPLSTGTYKITLTANCPGSVSSAGGYVAGNLKLTFRSGTTTCTYYLGSGGAYAPVTINSLVTAASGTLTASTTGSDHPFITSSGLNWNKDANRYWTLWAAGDSINATNYGATFTFAGGDLDSGASTLSFVVGRYRASAWTLPTPVTASATTTAVTGLGAITSATDFVVGEPTPPSASYSIQASNFSPCNSSGSAQSIVTISPLDSGGNIITSYIKAVNLAALLSGGGASSATWSIQSANGSLVGSQYGFVAADNGTARFYLTDSVVENVYIRVSENGGATSTTLGTPIQYTNISFTITSPDALGGNAGGGVVAGRNHLMNVASTCGTAYTGTKNLDGWHSRDSADPGGGAPLICATNGGGSCLPATGSCSSALPSAAPGLSSSSNNLPALSFDATGVARFCLATSDVGRYTLSIRDDSNTAAPISGTSASLTARPFAVVVSDIAQGGINNPASTSASSASALAAGSNFSATVGGYLWNSAADSGGSGRPDASANLATVTAAGRTTHYADTVMLTTDTSLASNFVPNGGSAVQGILSNGSVAVVGGSGTAATLQYSEVGSFKLKATPSSNYLGGGVDLASQVAIYADNASVTSWVGRFRPDHFNTQITQGCATGGFTYSGQPFAAVTISAMNGLAIPTVTANYDGSASFSKAVTLAEANAVAGSFSTTSVAANSFVAGVALPTLKYVLAGSVAVPPAPGNIKLRASDSDGASSQTGTEASALIRSGWLKLTSYAVSSMSSLQIPVTAYYWGGNSWVRNGDDACTTIPSSSVALYNYLDSRGATATWTTSASGPGTLVAGQGTITLSAPSGTGSVNVVLNLGVGTQDNSCLTTTHATMAAPSTSLAFLRGKNGNCAASTSYSYVAADPSSAADPSATATFGVFTPESRKAVHVRELF